MLKNYFKIAWRNMLRHRTATLINLSGLNIGMTAAFFIFMWVENEFSYNRYHPNAEDIYRLTAYFQKDGTKEERTPWLMGEELKKQLSEVQAFTRIRPITGNMPTVNINQQLFKEKAAAYVDENWFKVFHFDFIQGNPGNFNSQPYSLVISESKAKKYFGSADAVGKNLLVDDTDYLVQGVIRDAPTNSSFHYDFYMPVAARHADLYWRKWDMYWDRNSYRTYIRLQPTASIEKMMERTHSIQPEIWKKYYHLGLIALGDTHFETGLEFSDLHHGDQKTAKILLLLGILLLAIACINYVNLTTARATIRIKEVNIRKIVGAERKQLFMQFVTESALLGFVAFLTTLLLAWISLPVFNRFADSHFELSLASPSLWKLLGGTLLGTLALTSIYPALLLSSFMPVTALRGKSIWGIKDGSLRKALVVMQFTISIALITGTIVIYEQMQFINRQYDAYDKSRVFTFLFPDQEDDSKSRARKESVKQELLAHSSIQKVALGSGSSLINVYNPWGPFDWDGRDPDMVHHITFLAAGSNFSNVLNLDVKEGRWFLPHNQADKKNVVLNETAVRELDIRQPVIGQRFVNNRDTGVIVGVVKDFHFLGLRERISPIVFSNNPEYINSFVVKSVPGKQAEARNAAEQIFKKFIPGEPFDYQFVSAEFEQLYRADYKAASLLWTFSLFTIFVSCLGLYGLATFSAERRNKEIGIRKVLGASVSGVVALLSKDFVKLVLIAILIATPIAWYFTNHWLENFAYRIDIQWWMFALAGLLAVVIAMLTVSFQSIKAALTNPVKSLRSE